MPCGILHDLRQEVFGEAFERGGELLAFGAQHLEDLGLGARYLLFGGHLAEEAEEVEAHQGVAVIDEVDLLLQAGAHGDVDQGLGDAAAFGRGAEAVLLFGNLFGDLQGVGANGAEGRGHFFRSVISHVSPQMDLSSLPADELRGDGW